MGRDLKKENMSNVDAAWYRMEDPTNLMMVTGFMYFDEPISRTALQEVIEKKLLHYNRFRQVVKDPNPTLRAPYWEEDRDFDINYHIVREELAGDYEQLKKRAGDLMSKPLDFNRPLWQAHLIDGCGKGNAVLLRTHHCIADGIALIGVLLSMTGKTAEESQNLEPHEKKQSSRLNESGNLLEIAGNALSRVGKATGKMLESLTQPAKLLDIAKFGTQSAVTAAKLVLKSKDPLSRFKGELGIAKKAVWSEPIPLEHIKRIKNVTKTTVNDVLLTAMTGGLRRYLTHHEQETEGLEFRATVPVNLRRPDKFHELGNKFGLVFLDLPVGIADSLERLFALKKNMDAIKNSPEAIVAFGILKAVGMTPAEIQKIVVNIFGAKSTAVMTNVPGPKRPLYLGGKKIDHMMFWVPRSGRLGLGVSILSYAGEVRIGLAVDEGLVPDPELIIECFHRELEDLLELARQVDA